MNHLLGSRQELEVDRSDRALLLELARVLRGGQHVVLGEPNKRVFADLALKMAELLRDSVNLLSRVEKHSRLVMLL